MVLIAEMDYGIAGSAVGENPGYSDNDHRHGKQSEVGCFQQSGKNHILQKFKTI